MIRVCNLVKSYDGFLAVDDLSFTVEDGCICGFLGPNGAGKSTTMNILTGYLSATAGTVLVNGKSIVDEPDAVKRSIGYLPEVPPVYPDMTCGEYLTFAAKLKKVAPSGVNDEVLRCMRTAEVSHMKNRLIRNLSKGYRQRVGLACALLGDPPIIILDEPTNGFDPKQIIEMRQLITSLGNSHTVILSSHILSEVSAVCDAVVMISHGKLVASGGMRQLVHSMQPSNVYDITVAGDETEVRAAISQISDIQNVRIRPADDGICAVRIDAPAAADPRVPLFYSLAEAKCPILSLEMRSMDLEEIFLSLTENGIVPKEEAQ